MTSLIDPVPTGVLNASRFTRNRGAWTLAGLASLLLPFLWPLGGYILWKLYANRPGSLAPVTNVPPPVSGEFWQ